MQLKYFVIILALLSVTLLYLLSTFSHPIYITFSDIPDYEDKQVIINGVVCEHYLTSYDNQILTIRDENNSDEELTVFVETKVDIEYGDIIEATGSIQKYHDSWELVVSHPKNIKVISSWDNTSSPVWQLAEQPLKYLGLNVQTNGVIDRIYDSYYYLIDTSGRYSLAVYFNPQYNQNLTEGMSSCVSGRFLYDSENFRYFIDKRAQNDFSESVG